MVGLLARTPETGHNYDRVVTETLLSAAVVVLVLALSLLDENTMMAVGGIVTAVGLLTSTGLGVVYHLRLREALAPRNLLPRWWWLAPTSLHARLDTEGRDAVMPWFARALACMGVAALGFTLFLGGAVRAMLLG